MINSEEKTSIGLMEIMKTIQDSRTTLNQEIEILKRTQPEVKM